MTCSDLNAYKVMKVTSLKSKFKIQKREFQKIDKVRKSYHSWK